MYLVLGFFYLLLLVEGNNENKFRCKKRFSIDCQLRKVKWFYNPIAAMCLQRLTCGQGFTYRSDCERHCIDPRKQELQEPAKSLAEVQRILDQLNGKYKPKTKPPRPTRPTRPTPKKTKPSPVTTPVPVTSVKENLFASESPEELTIKDPLEVLDPSNLNFRKTTQYKKMARDTTTTTTPKKGLLEKVIEKPKRIYEQLKSWGRN